MNTSIVFTFIGKDKPGLVEKLSNTVAKHEGNWLESRMSQLAGQFAGITRVQVDEQYADILSAALTALSSDDLNITVTRGADSSAAKPQRLTLNLIGNDRPGILKELTSALATRQINVCELSTHITSAPMTAETLFEANATIEVPATLDMRELSDRLDEIENALSVDISLD